MKDFGSAALAEIAAGRAIGVGAVEIACAPTPVRVWGGFHDLELEPGKFFKPVGDRGLVSVVGAALGAAEQNITLELSGVAPEALAMFDMGALRRAPVVVYRLVFDSAGKVLLAKPVYARGRLDQAPKEETPGGEASIRALVETAARGLRRGGGRMRAHYDQVLVAPGDDGFKGVAYAGQTMIYWMGKVPQTAQQAFGGLHGGLHPGLLNDANVVIP